MIVRKWWKMSICVSQSPSWRPKMSPFSHVRDIQFTVIREEDIHIKEAGSLRMVTSNYQNSCFSLQLLLQIYTKTTRHTLTPHFHAEIPLLKTSILNEIINKLFVAAPGSEKTPNLPSTHFQRDLGRRRLGWELLLKPALNLTDCKTRYVTNTSQAPIVTELRSLQTVKH